MLSLFILTELNSNFVATDMKSQAYTPIWPNGPCLPRLQQGRNFFASGSHDVSGTQMIYKDFNYQILCQGLGLRFWVMLTVPISPNISTKLMPRASLSESLVNDQQHSTAVAVNTVVLTFSFCFTRSNASIDTGGTLNTIDES